MEIALTGAGIVSAIGNSKTEVLASLLAKKSGIGPMCYLDSAHKELPVGEVHLSDEEMKQKLGIPSEEKVSRTVLMGVLAVNQALEEVGKTALEGKRIALISGTTVGGMDLTERYFQQLKTDDSLLSILKKHDCGSSSQEIADLCGLKAEVTTISTACSSALNALILGAEMLKAGEVDFVIAGGSECLSKFHLNGFHSLMILDDHVCRPFDETRTGLNLGEGAAYVVMESAQQAQERGASIQAYVTGYANACDAFHQTASSENGEGAYLAMTQALEMAGLQPSEIQYVNAHGTGTPNNDKSESVALKRVFGEQMPPVSSTKSFTGHTTSASGAIETVICLLAMEHHFIPANLGWENPMENGFKPSLGASQVDLQQVVCNSFGFGGNDSSLVLSQQAIGKKLKTLKPVEIQVLAEAEIQEKEQLKDFREFMSPMEARRMGKLLKAATLTSLKVLKEAQVESPDAIITATAYGMLETSEKFLTDLCENGEETLSPTLFMQSTHNTLSSAIAIRTHCHGYNVTYTQGKESWEWAFRDARRLLQTGKAKTVLVGYHDESTELFRSFQERAGLPVSKEIESKSILLGIKE